MLESGNANGQDLDVRMDKLRGAPLTILNDCIAALCSLALQPGEIQRHPVAGANMFDLAFVSLNRTNPSGSVPGDDLDVFADCE
jgi:hypothetical protein